MERPPEGERNYHSFYQLLYGATAEEKVRRHRDRYASGQLTTLRIVGRAANILAGAFSVEFSAAQGCCVISLATRDVTICRVTPRVGYLSVIGDLRRLSL